MDLPTLPPSTRCMHCMFSIIAIMKMYAWSRSITTFGSLLVSEPCQRLAWFCLDWPVTIIPCWCLQESTFLILYHFFNIPWISSHYFVILGSTWLTQKKYQTFCALRSQKLTHFNKWLCFRSSICFQSRKVKCNRTLPWKLQSELYCLMYQHHSHGVSKVSPLQLPPYICIC